MITTCTPSLIDYEMGDGSCCPHQCGIKLRLYNNAFETTEK